MQVGTRLGTGVAGAFGFFLEHEAMAVWINLERGQVRLVATLEDGDALFEAMCERGLGGREATP